MRGEQLRRPLLPVMVLTGGGEWLAIETWVSNLSDLEEQFR